MQIATVVVSGEDLCKFVILCLFDKKKERIKKEYFKRIEKKEEEEFVGGCLQ